MKRRLLILTLLAALLLSACGGAPERTTPEESENTQTSGKSIEDCIELLKDIVKESFDEDSFEVSRDGDTVELTMWNDAIMEALPFALKNNQDAIDAFARTSTSISEGSAELRGMFQRAGHDEITTRVSIVDAPETRNIIFAAQNGKTVYDIVNHVDTLGVNKARAEAVAAQFGGLIDGAKISATGTYNKVEIHLATDFSAETKPENWEQLQQNVLERMDAINVMEGTTLYVMLETADGSILSTAANGKVSYDLYAKEESEAFAAAQGAGEDENDIIVYVSNSTNTIHSIGDCSGMKHYRGMKLSKALASGYSYCPHCW